MGLVDQLVKKGWLKTPRIIEAFRKIKRADFMPEDMRDLAELDEALPIDKGQTISQPLTVAFMMELLQPQPGDKILDVALSKIGDKGLFTKELENELLKGSIDIAVHSLKDLPTVLPEGLKLGAVTKRHPVEDILIARKKGMTIKKLPEGAVVATGSLRRSSQLLHIRPDIKIEELRGNVPTRINKFLESDWDAIILARAGVERLKLNKYISSIISTKDILPAVGQGALGIEIRSENKFAERTLKKIHNDKTYIAVRAERSLLK